MSKNIFDFNHISPDLTIEQELELKSYYESCHLNTERSYKWRLSGSAGQSEIGILCFDWLIHPGVSYSREICNFSGEFVIFQATAEGKIFRLFAFFLKRSAKTTRMTSTEHEFRHLHLIYIHFNLLFSLFHLCKHIDCFRVVYSM